jgi:methionine-rich copper-binding protein CopC
MRKRAAALLVAIVLGMSVIVATPAAASFGAVVQDVPETVYSPYGGPATVTFTFGESDEAAIFKVRLRRPGKAAIKTRDYLVDPEAHASPHEVSFPWKKLSVAAPTDYVIDVRRQSGGPALTSTPFTLLPPLVSNLSAKPSPFYPLVDDGYKDTTMIGFSLAADTTATSVTVFTADTYGRCCGDPILTEDFVPLPKGVHGWTWDGGEEDDSRAPKGTYFVKIGATDPDGLSMTSKALKVEITRGKIRLTATKQKAGRAYARVGDEQRTAIGGGCVVSRDQPPGQTQILCANANISVYWNWALKPGERIESVSFVIDGGIYGCHKSKGRSGTRSFLRVRSPPTSTCSVVTAKIRYSYPVKA